jgi:hypothetical protein
LNDALETCSVCFGRGSTYGVDHWVELVALAQRIQRREASRAPDTMLSMSTSWSIEVTVCTWLGW